MRIGLQAIGIGSGARPDVLAEAARAADAAGFARLWVGEHVVLFDNQQSRYPYSESGEFSVAADFGLDTPLALSDDGGILAAGSNPITETENAIRLWDTHNGRLLGVCTGHTQGVRWLAFSPDGETLASVSDDSNLRFWNVRTQQELFSIQRLADPVRDILFSPNGHWLAAKTLGGLRLLDASGDRDMAKNTALGNGPADP